MPKKNTKSYDNLKGFAAALDKPLTTLSRWVKHEEWKWSRKAPWSAEIVPDVLRWAAEVLQRGRPLGEKSDGPVDPNDVRELRKEKLRKEIRKLHAQADTAETGLARERGQLILAEQVETEWAAMGTLMRTGFQNLAGQIVPLALTHGMPNTAAGAFRKQIEDAVAAILRRLSNDGLQDDSDSAAQVL